MGNISVNLEKKIRGKEAVHPDVNRIKGGDVVWMQYREKIGSNRFKNFTGVCISKTKRGNDTILVLRNTIGGVGVEYGFHSLSPNIRDIKQVRAKTKRGGRAKRYNLRSVK